MDNKTMLLILMIVLIAFIVLLAVLGIVFIVALRKRAPVVKVVMAPLTQEEEKPETESSLEEAKEEALADESESESPAPAAETAPAAAAETEEEEDDDDAVTFVTEGQERVRYDRSITAKICQLKNESKEWYSEIKNELLSYEKVKDRMSWRRETFRIGRMTFARLVVRGKTLCLLLAVEPSGYSGTKYAVEDVSNVSTTFDTPTLYRIKSTRRLKYAKEMIAGLMKELKAFKNSHYEAQDFFMPYEGDMSLMQRGLVKRVVSGSTRTFKIEEVSGEEALAAEQTEAEAAATAPEEGK